MRYVPWLGRDLFHPLFSVTTSLWQVHSWPSYYSKSHKQGFSNKIQCSQIGRKLSIHNEIVSRTLSCLENFSSGYRFFSLSLEPWEWCCLWGSRSSILPKRNDCQKLLGDSTEGERIASALYQLPAVSDWIWSGGSVSTHWNWTNGAQQDMRIKSVPSF